MLHVNQQEERRIRQESLDLLDMLGLGDVAQEKASSLPYGKQRYLELRERWHRAAAAFAG